jgi:uncharacterized protein
MDLKAFLTENRKFAVAFSGGVDSSYLLHAAKTAGCDVKAYFIKSVFQPQFELDDAKKMAYMLSVPMTVETIDSLSVPEVAQNPADRCYYCKIAVFTRIHELAEADGYSIICDGTNASDDATERAGMRALSELGIRSPLRECGLTKKEVRSLSREAGLFTHDKPSYACLATRIPSGTPITIPQLEIAEQAEQALRAFGFTDFRIRIHGKTAKVQLPEPQFRLLVDRRKKILEVLNPFFDEILVDLKPRKTEAT